MNLEQPRPRGSREPAIDISQLSAFEVYSNQFKRFEHRSIVDELLRRAKLLLNGSSPNDNETKDGHESLHYLATGFIRNEPIESWRSNPKIRTIRGPKVYADFFDAFIDRSICLAISGQKHGLSNLVRLYQICSANNYKQTTERALRPICDLALGNLHVGMDRIPQDQQAVIELAGEKIVSGLVPLLLPGGRSDSVSARLGNFVGGRPDGGVRVICRGIVRRLEAEAAEETTLVSMVRNIFPGLRTPPLATTLCADIFSNSPPSVCRILASTLSFYDFHGPGVAQDRCVELLSLACLRRDQDLELQNIAVSGLISATQSSCQATVELAKLVLNPIILPEPRENIVIEVRAHKLPSAVREDFKAALKMVANNTQLSVRLRELAAQK